MISVLTLTVIFLVSGKNGVFSLAYSIKVGLNKSRYMGTLSLTL